jgi:hypothetical protein
MDNTTNLMPFLKEEKGFHRDLYLGTPPDRKPRTEYTLKNFWDFFLLSTYVTKEAEGRYFPIRTERLLYISSMLGEARPPLPSELKWLETALEKYGLQVLLFAIDSYADTDWSKDSASLGVPNLVNLLEHIHSSSVYLSKLVREYNLEKMEALGGK